VDEISAFICVYLWMNICVHPPFICVRRWMMYLCLVRDSSSAEITSVESAALADVAADMSPRVEVRAPGLVVADVSGLSHLFGDARAIAQAAAGLAAERSLQVRAAVAGTWVAAYLLARVRPGITVVGPSQERTSLATVPVEQLSGLAHDLAGIPEPSVGRGFSPAIKGSSRHYRMAPGPDAGTGRLPPGDTRSTDEIFLALRRWGIQTCGDLARLAPADLHARFGRDGVALHALACGEDPRPLVPSQPVERFEECLDLEWPIDGLEPLSFVLARLLDPLCARLERRDRGAAVLRLRLDLVTRAARERTIELPSPLRDPKVLRTLLLLDLESHPPDAAIDRVTIAVHPVPGRIVQYALLDAHPLPVPERLTTLLARLTALAGEGRVGAPALDDSHRPDAFTMTRYTIDRASGGTLGFQSPVSGLQSPAASREPRAPSREPPAASRESPAASPQPRAASRQPQAAALRRLRQPWPVRVRLDAGRPVYVQSGAVVGGRVVQASGPWRSSGEWWKSHVSRGMRDVQCSMRNDETERHQPRAASPQPRAASREPPWDRDEWDVVLAAGVVYRIFRDRLTGQWFLEGELD
jgi:protein ImuB